MNPAQLCSEVMEAPANGQAYWIAAEDGVRLRVAVWSRQSDRGTVFVFPGRSDYIEMYGHTVGELTRRGLSAVVVDWRGHGLSDRIATNRQIGHVASFLDYQKDAAAMFAHAAALGLPRPYFLLGHSMGACIGLRALSRGLDVEAAVFTAPMWDIHLPLIQRIAAWPITWLASSLGKGDSFAPGYNGTSYVLKHPFDGNRLTSDPEMYAYWVRQGTVAPELHTGGPSMKWLFEALRETRNLSSCPSPNMRCLVFYGEDEQLVDVSAIKRRMASWPKGRLVSFPNARHELLLEKQDVRKRVLSDACELFLQG